MKQTAKRELTQEKIASVFSALEGSAIQEVLLERSKNAALELGLALLEADVESLCGPAYARKGGELCHRGGSEKSSIIVGGARYEVRRPRVRNDEEEVELPMLKKLRNQDLLDKQMREKMLLGVSTRNYKAVTEGYAKKLGVSKSSVSRAFERASQKDLDAINHSALTEETFLCLMVDGLEIAGRMVVAALGVTSELKKLPVGLIEGDTENADVVKELLASLQERGFTLHCKKLLAVIDGSKALKKGLKQVFGDRLVVQRCWLHKVRNLKQYVPERLHAKLLWRMKRLMHLRSLEEAKKEYESLHKWLEEISPTAAESLDEAGEELLTVHALSIVGELRKSLSCTNAIESLFSVVRGKISRVKNWRSRPTNQILRWVAASVNEHRKKMRRLRGLNQQALLIEALGVRVEAMAA